MHCQRQMRDWRVMMHHVIFSFGLVQVHHAEQNQKELASASSAFGHVTQLTVSAKITILPLL
jgi:hypothetical protein